MIYCCKLLLDFNGMLNSADDSQQIAILKLRISIAEYYSDILGKMILFNGLNRLMRIEHFLENEDFDHLKLEKLIPDDFPNHNYVSKITGLNYRIGKRRINTMYVVDISKMIRPKIRFDS